MLTKWNAHCKITWFGKLYIIISTIEYSKIPIPSLENLIMTL